MIASALQIAAAAAALLGGGAVGTQAPKVKAATRKGPRPMNATDAQIEARIALHGIRHPKETVRAAKRSRLELRYACAMLMMETGGGTNEFGHDDETAGVAGLPVTKERYEQLLADVDRGETSNGVGPCQLTSLFLLQEADKLGGAWKPEPNMLVGFRYLHELIHEFGEQDGFAAYNGGPGGINEAAPAEYGERAVAYARELEQIIDRHNGGD